MFNIRFHIKSCNGIIKTSALLLDRAVENDRVEVTKFKMTGPAKDHSFKQTNIHGSRYSHIQVMDYGIFLFQQAVAASWLCCIQFHEKILVIEPPYPCIQFQE